MDPTQVAITLAFAEIKSLCEHYPHYPDEVCEPGEKMLAAHILGIINRHLSERSDK